MPGQGMRNRLRTESVENSENVESDDESESSVWFSYTSTDMVIVSPRRDTLRVPVLKKSDISLLRNDGYWVFVTKSIVPDVDKQFFGSQPSISYKVRL